MEDINIIIYVIVVYFSSSYVQAAVIPCLSNIVVLFHDYIRL